MFNSAIDALLYDDALTRPCRLIYSGSKWEDCSNCTYDPIGRKSSGRYQSGGPNPFPAGSKCPHCAGAGKKQASSTEEINMMIIWDTKQWLKLGHSVESRPSKIHTPGQLAQTLSKIETWPQLNRANEIVLDTDVERYKQLKYMRMGDPELCGIGSSRYVLTMWDRGG